MILRMRVELNVLRLLQALAFLVTLTGIVALAFSDGPITSHCECQNPCGGQENDCRPNEICCCCRQPPPIGGWACECRVPIEECSATQGCRE